MKERNNEGKKERKTERRKKERQKEERVIHTHYAHRNSKTSHLSKRSTPSKVVHRVQERINICKRKNVKKIWKGHETPCKHLNSKG
jgi:hypothetical protein